MVAKIPLDVYLNGEKRFGMFTVLGDADPIMSGGTYRRMVKCQCDCGTIKDVDAPNLKRGLSKSCGCQFYRRPAPIEEVCQGVRHGWLTVIGDTRRKMAKAKGSPIRYAICKCDCGSVIEVPPYDLRSGNTKSCGCGKAEFTNRTRTTHGMTNTPEYGIWAGMKGRALNQNGKAWPGYGGRGIGICERWEKFENFFEDMGFRPSSELSLDRKNNNEGYSKENCHWGTKAQQARNRRNIKRITVGGIDMSVPDLAALTMIDSFKIKQKIKEGLTGDQIIAMVLEGIAKLPKS